jgi:hypothetical protein
MHQFPVNASFLSRFVRCSVVLCTGIARFLFVENSDDDRAWGFQDMVSKTQLGEFLNDTSLAIHVQMQIRDEFWQVLRPMFEKPPSILVFFFYSTPSAIQFAICMEPNYSKKHSSKF